MSEKRRDTKGRILRDGELQRNDGKYEFRYIDIKGVRRSVYSWKLVETDSVPKGKRSKESLRSIEKRIVRDVDDEILAYEAYSTTLNSFFEKYISSKVEIKSSTRVNYKYMYKTYVENEIGYKRLSVIKYSDIRQFYLSLIHEKGFKPNSMEIINTILHPVFAMAVRDGYIRLNPTDGVMAEIKRTHDWEKPKRHALTEAQQSAFVDFISKSHTYKHWNTIFTVLLGTGCRIGEVVGLRWEDVDFGENIIDINHSLIYRKDEGTGKVRFHITTPKTKAGSRIIPMLDDVQAALIQERIRQMQTGYNESVVDGYSGFIFQNRYGECLSPHCVNRAIERITRDYNKAEELAAEKENRKPELLPHFTVHNLRHTFCTRFCENETNLKVIQEIMGHADITTTMDIYNEATREKKIASFENLEGKIKIS
jgi:integrase